MYTILLSHPYNVHVFFFLCKAARPFPRLEAEGNKAIEGISKYPPGRKILVRVAIGGAVGVHFSTQIMVNCIGTRDPAASGKSTWREGKSDGDGVQGIQERERETEKFE